MPIKISLNFSLSSHFFYRLIFRTPTKSSVIDKVFFDKNSPVPETAAQMEERLLRDGWRGDQPEEGVTLNATLPEKLAVPRGNSIEDKNGVYLLLNSEVKNAKHLLTYSVFVNSFHLNIKVLSFETQLDYGCPWKAIDFYAILENGNPIAIDSDTNICVISVLGFIEIEAVEVKVLCNV